ncbi:MAG TPA: O-antigen ligase family protein [Thermoanaerobaculia bacterium]
MFSRLIGAVRNGFASLSPHGLLRWTCFFYLGHIIFQGKIAPSELGAFWAIFCLGWAMARREARFSFHILYYPLALYGVVSTLSAAAAEARIHAGFESMLWFKMLIFPAALILYRTIPRMRGVALAAQIIFGVGIAAWGIFEFLVLDQRELERRINGPSTHVMTFSGLLLPLSLMLLLLWWHQRKLWQLGATVIVSLTLLLTFTRGVWLGWLFAVIVILVLARPKLLFYLPIVLLWAIILMPLPLFGRMMSIFDAKQSSNLDRIRMLEAGVEMIRDYPLLGVGPANVKEVYPLYKKHDAPRFRPPHLHNNVVQLWAERGILGLVAYLMLLVLFLRECARGWRSPGEGRMWAEIGIAVTAGLTWAGLFEFNFGDTEVFYLMLELFALVVASIEASTTASANEPVVVPVPAISAA